MNYYKEKKDLYNAADEQQNSLYNLIHSEIKLILTKQSLVLISGVPAVIITIWVIFRTQVTADETSDVAA